MFKSIKNNSHLSKNDKIGVNQQEMLNDFNISINKKLKEFNSSSETTRVISFNQWLGGIMDSDGCFYLNKNNYLSCEISLSLRELDSLNKIKAKFGGAISKRVKENSFRWRLTKKNLIQQFLIALNGNIHYKKEKFEKVMGLYLPDVFLISNNALSGAWLSGFFEGDGYVNINTNNYQITLSVSQKTKFILEKIQEIYGGNIYHDQSWDGYKWEVSNKEDLISLFKYFTLYPLKSKKNSDIVSAKRFFRYKLLDYHLNPFKHQHLNHFIKLFQERKKI
jgi:ubiquinol-cytochrome c reductase cytochrome b subunit